MEFKEIIYDKRDGIAYDHDQPAGKYNACTPVTIYELSQAFTDAWVDTGWGGRAHRRRGQGVLHRR